MIVMSSTISAVCGRSSLSHAPLWPCCVNLKIDGATGKLFCPEVIVVIRWPMRTESGSSVPASSLGRRLVVEQVHLRRGARLEEVDDALRPGCEMRQARQALGHPPALRVARRPGRADIGAGPDAARHPAAIPARPIPGPDPEREEEPAIDLLSDLQSVHGYPRCQGHRCAAIESPAGSDQDGHSWLMVSSRFKITPAVAV